MTSWPRVLSPRPMARYGYRSPKEPHVVMTIRRPGYVALGPVVITVISPSATGKRPNKLLSSSAHASVPLLGLLSEHILQNNLRRVINGSDVLALQVGHLVTIFVAAAGEATHHHVIALPLGRAAHALDHGMRCLQRRQNTFQPRAGG